MWHAAGNVVERIAEIDVLAEDLRQANLVRHYLIRCGHHQRSILLRLALRGKGSGEQGEAGEQGKGSGEQYVRERYAIEVAYCRHRLHFRKAALATVLDADTGSVEEHERELTTALAAADEGNEGTLKASNRAVPVLEGTGKPSAKLSPKPKRSGTDCNRHLRVYKSKLTVCQLCAKCGSLFDYSPQVGQRLLSRRATFDVN